MQLICKIWLGLFFTLIVLGVIFGVIGAFMTNWQLTTAVMVYVAFSAFTFYAIFKVKL